MLECHEVPCLPREMKLYATLERSKSNPFCRTSYRHGHAALTRTVANGCERLRTTPTPPEWNGNPCYAFGKNDNVHKNQFNSQKCVSNLNTQEQDSCYAPQVHNLQVTSIDSVRGVYRTVFSTLKATIPCACQQKLPFEQLTFVNHRVFFRKMRFTTVLEPFVFVNFTSPHTRYHTLSCFCSCLAGDLSTQFLLCLERRCHWPHVGHQTFVDLAFLIFLSTMKARWNLFFGFPPCAIDSTSIAKILLT